ncbi:MAG: threonine synthase [Wenzhouxiangellaceae bacterium]|nr:threonine synthase [Wenzhouxiangellaceae bacterium]
MDLISTRNANVTANIDDALRAGLAPDGGLYVPARLPGFDPSRMDAHAALGKTALDVLSPFFEGSGLAERLDAICRDAFDLPLPITPLAGHEQVWLLELYHGPTAAFKDFAARFLARCLGALRADDAADQTVLVATSGDTGAAVAAAFHQRPGFRVVILYPHGRVSDRQAHMLGAFGDNVHAFEVRGDFDDCQRMVKHALADANQVRRFGLTSANSISIGRLLPQIAYYAWAALRLGREQPIDVIVPTGNLGNALACVLAREMGFGIDRVHLATNANRTLPDYFGGDDYRGRPGLKTLANAMDVGDPSNFERLVWLYREHDLRDAGIDAESIDDDTIRACIRHEHAAHGLLVCPHTACALERLARLREHGHRVPTLVAATAHPAKFETVIEPLVGESVPLPPALAELLARPANASPLEPQPDALINALAALDEPD